MIEPLSAADAETLARIHAAAFSKSWKVEDFERLLASPGVTGWRFDDAGFVLIRQVEDEAEILTIATEPCHQRRGIATQLMQRVLQNLRQARIQRCFLEVADTNTAAKALYQNFDFLAISVRKAYYATPSGQADAVVMQWRLPVDSTAV